jgi:hypothetical protein
MTIRSTMVLQTVFVMNLLSSLVPHTRLITNSRLKRPRTIGTGADLWLHEDVNRVAQQLTLMQAHFFYEINIRQLLKCAWMAPNGQNWFVFWVTFFEFVYLVLQVSDCNDRKSTMLLQTVLVLNMFSFLVCHALG